MCTRCLFVATTGSERAERKLRETMDDCNRRITEATRQVQELQSLRQRLTEQIRSAHALIREATPLLEPLRDEQHTVDGVNAAGQAAQAGQRNNQPPNGQKGQNGQNTQPGQTAAAAAN